MSPTQSAVISDRPLAGGSRWQFSLATRAFIVAAIAVAALPFAHALVLLFGAWNLEPEYSHGMLIPFISLYLIWQQREWLARTPFKGAWSGLVVIAGGLFLWLVGELSTIPAIIHYGFLGVLYGLVLSLTGWAVFRRLWMPFLILVFMIPLPEFFNASLSLKLQLISSAIGVALIRLFGISVFLEGNVIDLGAMQLQVAEACDGLRYLFPLMTLAFILSYFFRAPLWKRITLFIASIPIAILMNSLRIGAIGVTVEYWGIEMAQGVLHDFEGWVMFMASTVALLGVGALLARIGANRSNLRDALNFTPVNAPTPSKDAPAAEKRPLPHAFIAAATLATLASVSAFIVPPRPMEAAPARDSLTQFPTTLGEWRGSREAIESVYLDTLKLDDYVMANYRGAAGSPVNFYVAYYDSQRKGHSVHSPRSCIPGGGWVITDFRQTSLPAGAPGQNVPVNRAVVEMGRNKQIVYYWFQQRGRTITNEYLVKWFIFWDALTRNRTDGALVRVTAPLMPGATEADVDAQIARFVNVALPKLHPYIPD